MNEIQIEGKKQEVEGKKVYDFADTPFHKYWIFGFVIGFSSDSKYQDKTGHPQLQTAIAIIKKIRQKHFWVVRKTTKGI